MRHITNNFLCRFHCSKLTHPKYPQNGTTALMCACESGRVGAARLLLAAGADPNAADCDGWTPLAFAARGGHLATVKELLDAGAKVDPRDCVRKFIPCKCRRCSKFLSTDTNPVDDDGWMPLAYRQRVPQCWRQSGPQGL